MAFDRVGIHDHLLNAQVAKGGFVNIPLVVQGHADLVDNLVAAPLADHGAHQSRFVAVHIMLAQDFLHCLDTGQDAGLVGRGAVLPQQVFEHIGGDDGVALDQLHQVFAYDQTGELGVNLFIQRRHFRYHGSLPKNKIADTGYWVLRPPFMMWAFNIQYLLPNIRSQNRW